MALRSAEEILLQKFPGLKRTDDGELEGHGAAWRQVTTDSAVGAALYAALPLVGLDPTAFAVTQFEVRITTPAFPGRQPDQLVIAGPGYEGIHEARLVKRNAFVTATEIKSDLARARR